MQRVVILGAGCGGLSTARALRFAPVSVMLVDRGDFHVLKHRLYALATGRSGLGNPLLSLDAILTDQSNLKRVSGEVVYLDAARRRLILADQALAYDTLVVAAGVQARYEREAWAPLAPALHTATDAARIANLLERSGNTAILGGGATGVELAAEIARTGRRVVLAETEGRVLPELPERFGVAAAQRLARLGVEIRTGHHVLGIGADGVRVSGPQGRVHLSADAVLWAGGVRGAEFGEALARETGVPLTAQARVPVRPDLTLPGHPEIFVIGDLAACEWHGEPLPALATVAAQQGRHVAAAIRDRLAGYDARPFQYVDQGQFVRIGHGGVGRLGDTLLTGAAARLAAEFALRWGAPRPKRYSATAASRT